MAAKKNKPHAPLDPETRAALEAAGIDASRVGNEISLPMLAKQREPFDASTWPTSKAQRAARLARRAFEAVQQVREDTALHGRCMTRRACEACWTVARALTRMGVTNGPANNSLSLGLFAVRGALYRAQELLSRNALFASQTSRVEELERWCEAMDAHVFRLERASSGKNAAEARVFWCSARDVAGHFDLPVDVARKRLERARADDPGGDWYHEIAPSERRSREPRYFYDLEKVAPFLR